MPFVKLDCGIIHSSLWAESSDTRICWITLLVLADATGLVRAVSSAIAREAGISAEAARSALELFALPDDESRSPENKGKRIEKVDGGYRVLNYEKYREHDYKNAERQRRFRAKRKNNAVTAVTVTQRNVTVTHADADADAKKKKSGTNKSCPPQSIEDWLKDLSQNKTYAGINVAREYGKMLEWCKLRGNQPTKLRFLRWLNRIDKPIFDVPRKVDPAMVNLPERFKSWAAETYPDRCKELMRWQTWADAPSWLRQQWSRHEKDKLPVNV